MDNDDEFEIIDSQVPQFCPNEPDMKAKAVYLMLKHIDKFTKDDLELLQSYINSIYRRRWITTPLPSEYKRKLDAIYTYGLRLNVLYNLFTILRNLKAGKNISAIGISIMSIISSLL